MLFLFPMFCRMHAGSRARKLLARLAAEARRNHDATRVPLFAVTIAGAPRTPAAQRAVNCDGIVIVVTCYSAQAARRQNEAHEDGADRHCVALCANLQGRQ